MCAIPPQTDTRKSTSLQALTNNYSANNSIGPAATGTPVGGIQDRNAWSTLEQIGGKISIDLANGSSANNSGRGSRSSGLQDAGSEVHSVGGLDTAISHHHNAASLTRFDTENRDFDQRLAQIIQVLVISKITTLTMTCVSEFGWIFCERVLDASRFSQSVDFEVHRERY